MTNQIFQEGSFEKLLRFKVADGRNGSPHRYMDGMVMACPSRSELNCLTLINAVVVAPAVP